jgi:orotate phosphoribosyltransferase
MPARYQKNTLIELLKRDALQLGTFVLASGRTSHYYVDGRRVTLSAEGASQIAAGMLDIIDTQPEISAVGGLTLGADPIVGAILAAAPLRGRRELRGFLVRKEVKGHGTGKRIEGPVEPGMHAVIVDDVATTGASSLQAINAAEAIGCVVDMVVAVLDRMEGAAEVFARRGIAFRALTTIRDLGVEPVDWREPTPAEGHEIFPDLEAMPPLQGP